MSSSTPPYQPQELYRPSAEEIARIENSLATWMQLEEMATEVETLEQRLGWSVRTASKLQRVREARQCVDFLRYLESKGMQVDSLRMELGTWPDCWIQLKGHQLPCELTEIYIPEHGVIGMPIDMQPDGALLLDANKDYSDWPDEKTLWITPHAGRFNSAFADALETGSEVPLGGWPQLEILRNLPTWVEKEVCKKNAKAMKGNYVGGSVLVMAATFEIKVAIPLDLIERLHSVMKLGTAFRAVFLHVPNSMGVVWHNPNSEPFDWMP